MMRTQTKGGEHRTFRLNNTYTLFPLMQQHWTFSSGLWGFIAELQLWKTSTRPLTSDLSVETVSIGTQTSDSKDKVKVCYFQFKKHLCVYPLAKRRFYIIALRIMQTCSNRRAALYDSSSLDSACKTQTQHTSTLCGESTATTCQYAWASLTCLRNCRPK